MKMNAWMRVGAIGFAASLFVAGCVVNSTSDNDAGTNTGGTGGGTGGTGGGTAGTGGGTAGTGGGTAGTGGSGGVTACDPSNPANGKCDTCTQTTCCTEWLACANNAYCPTEFKCISDCVLAVIADAGAATDSDKAACANSCPDSASGSSTIDQTTNDLFACANDPAPEAGTSCAQDCFGG